MHGSGGNCDGAGYVLYAAVRRRNFTRLRPDSDAGEFRAARAIARPGAAAGRQIGAVLAGAGAGGSVGRYADGGASAQQRWSGTGEQVYLRSDSAEWSC